MRTDYRREVWREVRRKPGASARAVWVNAGQAGDLAAEHALRGYDAVHLACALHLEGDDVVLATWDNALNSAARATGQLIANDIG